MTPISGTASLIARVARLIRLSGLRISEPVWSFSASSTFGKVAIAGMPSFAARSASRASRSTDRRVTPGIAATSSCRFSPSTTKTGQIRSSTVSRVSCTSRRDQSALRMRRSRRLPVISSTLREAEGRGRAMRFILVHSGWRRLSTLCKAHKAGVPPQAGAALH